MPMSTMMRACARPVPLAVFALMGGLAGAPVEATPLPETLRFDAWWGGMDAAEIAFVADQQGEAYHGHLSIRTHGLTHWMTGLVFEADCWGTLTQTAGAAAPVFQPYSYAQWSSSKDRARRVDLRFPEGARGAVETVRDQETRPQDGTPIPPDPTDETPPVPSELRRNVFDPVSALLEMGRRSMAGEQAFTVPVFDGRRRYDVAVTVIGPGRHDVGGTSYDTLDLQAVMHPVAGFKPKGVEFWKNAGFAVYVGRDVGLPVKVESLDFTASTVIGLQQVCRGRPCPPKG